MQARADEPVGTLALAACKLASPSPGNRPACRAKTPKDDAFSALVSAATPLVPLSNSNSNRLLLTPWGYPHAEAGEGATLASGVSGASSSDSWETVRAGLFSPPGGLSALLLSPPDYEIEGKQLDEIGEQHGTNQREHIPSTTHVLTCPILIAFSACSARSLRVAVCRDVCHGTGAPSPKDEETASSPTADEEDPTTVAGRGGWLVDLVEGIELWALPSTAEQQQLPAAGSSEQAAAGPAVQEPEGPVAQ